MTRAHRSLLRLAIAACDHGDVTGARALLVAMSELNDDDASGTHVETFAETFAAFGSRIGKSARTVRAMVRDGRIPASAVVGSGSGRRIVVADGLAALRPSSSACASAEQAGAHYIERRQRMRVVGGER